MSTPNYPANSKKSKEEAQATGHVKKFDSVVTTKVTQKKPSLGRRVAETFAGDDARSVGNYLLFDVIIPAAKSLIFDTFSQGLERSLFGTSSPRTSTRAGSSRTRYNKMYVDRDPYERDERRSLSRRARATHDFDEIVIENRGEAEEILDKLTYAIEEFDVVSVNDLYDLVDISGNYTDDKWGWTNLRDARVRKVPGGYLLELPRPVLLE